jgi:hypothetical protein
LEIVPAVTEPGPPLQVASVSEHAPIARAAGWLMVSEQVTELQLSLAVKAYVSAGKPLILAVVPTIWLDEFVQL